MKKIILTLITLSSLNAQAQMGFITGYALGSSSGGGETTNTIAVPVGAKVCMLKLPLMSDYHVDEMGKESITVNSSMIAYIKKYTIEAYKRRDSRFEQVSSITYVASKIVMANGDMFGINLSLPDLEKRVQKCNEISTGK